MKDKWDIHTKGVRQGRMEWEIGIDMYTIDTTYKIND